MNCLHFACVLVVLLCIVQNGIADRKLTFEVNPGCNETHRESVCDAFKFIHVLAKSSDDSLHYFWLFSGGPPSFLVVPAPLSSLPEFTYDPEIVIRFPNGTYNSFGASLTKLYEFDDSSDSGDINQSSDITVWPLDTGTWNITSVTVSGSGDQVQAEIVPLGGSDALGDLKFTVTAYGNDDRSSSMPHLLHSTNSSQIDLVLKNVNISSCQNKRLALEVAAVVGDASNFSLSYTKSLDDEYTPGVFELYHFKPTINSGKEGYLQWRPVAYTSSARDVEDSVGLTTYDVIQYSNSSLTEDIYKSSSLFYAFYGSQLSTLNVQATNVSFGIADDANYDDTSFLSWTFLVGYGDTPVDQLSVLVILIIAIGFGLPALLIVVGVTYVGVRRVRKRRNALLASDDSE